MTMHGISHLANEVTNINRGEAELDKYHIPYIVMGIMLFITFGFWLLAFGFWLLALVNNFKFKSLFKSE